MKINEPNEILGEGNWTIKNFPQVRSFKTKAH